MLCGLICSGMPEPRQVWIGELLAGTREDDLLAGEARQTLEDLYRHTRAELDGPRLGFRPLLPDDGCPLSERALGVYDWARGFLYGLGIAGVKIEDLSEQSREAFNDFIDITRMDLNALDEGEGNEEALTELTEFIWVAAMLVYEERTGSGGQP